MQASGMASTCIAVAIALAVTLVGIEFLWDALTMPDRDELRDD